MAARYSPKYHLALICALSTVLVAGVVVAAGRVPGFGWLPRWELQFRDLLSRHGKRNPPDPQLLFLGIDNDSVSLEERDLATLFADVPHDSPEYRALTLMARQWPWPREVYALVLDRLHLAGARLVIFDLLFIKPAPDDDIFRQALDRYRDQVIIGSNFVPQTLPDGMEAWTQVLPSDSLVPQAEPLDPRVAFVNFWPNPADGLIRQARFRVTAEGVSSRKPDIHSENFLSVAARALTQIGQGRKVPPQPDSDWIFRYTAPPGEGFHPLPIYQLFVPKYRKANFGDGQVFRDKIVIIGATGDWQHDVQETPFGRMDGAELQLNAINALLHGDFLKETTLVENILLVVVAGVAAWLLVAFNLKPVTQFSLALLGNALAVQFSLLAFDYLHLYVTVVAPLLAFNLGANGGGTYKFVFERIDRIRTRRIFERYVSKDVVQELLDNRQSVLHMLGGARRPVTVLFSDLRGFTSLTEATDPVVLVAQLNEYFHRMVRVVFAQAGTLDKFMGDGLMAHWGSLATAGERADAGRAVRAALEMRAAMVELNAEWSVRGLKPLSFGVGINSGEVVVGNIGSVEKMEVSLVGDPVNLAARLEGATKQSHVDILLGETTAALVKDDFILRSVDRLRVKGKTQAVDVFTVLAERAPGTHPPEWLELHEEIVGCFRRREFARAIELCDRASRLIKGDYLIEEYRRRSEALLHKVPSAQWSGIQILDEK